MARIVKQPDIVQTLLDLQKRIRVLENAPRLTASNLQTNGNSRLSVSNSSGNTVHQAGDLVSSTPGVNVSGIAVYRPITGTTAFAAAATPGGAAQYGFVDQHNLNVLQTNETLGYGLEDPSIPIPLYPNANIPSTTSGTPTLMWLGGFNCTHGYLDVEVQAAVSGGATATISIQVNNVTVATQTSTAAGFTTLLFSNISAVGATPKTLLGLNVLASISSGAGTVQVSMVYARLHGSLG